MILTIYTLIHVLISLLSILSGLIVVVGWLTAKRLNGWTAVFLTTAVLTSLTGFFFPVRHILPSHVVGFISLVVLAVAIYARHVRHLKGAWRKVYVAGAMLALYLNVFVAIFQAFLKVAVLHTLAPTQTEAPFKLTQLVVLALFVGLAIVAAIRFQDKPAPTT
ncbi:MAG: hypothetical protein P4N60_08810 [Verrucomicrobiae bacterium]|nr:hypothetical protein [Verrucomicrobiae bacterium]